MDRFPKEIAVAFDGNADKGERVMLVDAKPESHVTLHGTARVGIYKLDRIVTVKNESRIVRPKRKR